MPVKVVKKLLISDETLLSMNAALQTTEILNIKNQSTIDNHVQVVIM